MITVRRIEPSEWRSYRELRLRALQDAPDAFGSTYGLEQSKPDHFWADRLSAAAASGQDAPLFAMDGDRICGLAWCKRDPDDPQRANLFQMWVAPESRGLGAGRQLLLAALDWAQAVGARRVRLGVTVGDSPATRLYLANGFVRLGAPEPLREGSPLMAQSMEWRQPRG